MDTPTLQELVAAGPGRQNGGSPLCALYPLRLPQVLDVHNHRNVAPTAFDIRTQLLALLERQDASTAGVKTEAGDGAAAAPGQAASGFARDAVERLTWTRRSVRAAENRITLLADAVEPAAEGT